jgi:glucosylceramidase
MISRNYRALLLILCIGFFLFCKPAKNNTPSVESPINTAKKPVEVWTTSGDMSYLLSPKTIDFAAKQNNTNPTIEVDTAKVFQSIDGFGYTLTGGSATLMHKLNNTDRQKLLKELFGNDSTSIGVSYLRVSIGASDLSSTVFSYNDIATGTTDIELKKFSLSQDTVDLLPVLKEILTINPNIKILGSPWSPPVWMKTNGSSKGGNLKPEYYSVYARYFVKYIRAMAENGIKIDAVTLQNEPHHGGNNPSMILNANEAIDFVKNHLGPLFKKENLKTKIIIWDHNCDEPDYPISVLNDAGAKAFIDGSAFHMYNGNATALSTVYAVHPDKNLYFTEQWTGSKGEFKGDFLWHIKNVIIGTMRNHSRVALEWNMANDAQFNPHTEGGCTECKGALTIDNQSITRNVSYYIIGQISKFVPAGSARINSTMPNNIANVAFKRPDGKKVVVVLNENNTPQPININCNGKWITDVMPVGAAATYIW